MNHDAASPVLDSTAFYRDCFRVLADGGLMTVNLFGRDASFERMQYARELCGESDISPGCAAVRRSIDQAVMRRRNDQIFHRGNSPDNLGVTAERSRGAPRGQGTGYGNRGGDQSGNEKKQTNGELRDECDSVCHQ